MALPARSYPHDMVFRPFQPWVWLNSSLLLGTSLALAVWALLAREPRWLLLPLALLAWMGLLIFRHRAHMVVVSGASLICRRGLLRVRETTIPIARLNFEVRQTLLGRMLDYGTVRVAAPAGPIEMQQIASVHMLQSVIAERQTEVYLAPGWHFAQHP